MIWICEKSGVPPLYIYYVLNSVTCSEWWSVHKLLKQCALPHSHSIVGPLCSQSELFLQAAHKYNRSAGKIVFQAFLQRFTDSSIAQQAITQILKDQLEIMYGTKVLRVQQKTEGPLRDHNHITDLYNYKQNNNIITNRVGNID